MTSEGWSWLLRTTSFNTELKVLSWLFLVHERKKEIVTCWKYSLFSWTLLWKNKEVFLYSVWSVTDMQTFTKNNEINRKLVRGKYEKKRKKMKWWMLYLRIKKHNTHIANEVMRWVCWQFIIGRLFSFCMLGLPKFQECYWLDVNDKFSNRMLQFSMQLHVM